MTVTGRNLLILALAGAATLGLLALPTGAQRLDAPPPETVFLRDMTWVELRARIRAGATTVIVPTGGVEQNGPHMVLGKHGYIVTETARRIAVALGDAVVAPTIDTVPEGDIGRREGHMAFPGTISLPQPLFAALLESVAASLKAGGFRAILFLGDSGGNQAAQSEVATRLDALWRNDGVRVIALTDYYADNGAIPWLGGQGFTAAEIGRHAGIRDTAELMAAHPEGIRNDRLAPDGGSYDEPTGVDGDPAKATPEIGERLLMLKVEAALKQIRAELGAQ
jgi:creatinine amidohydrolase/Fe(II)-dependent formamide hydrolase-like protein